MYNAQYFMISVDPLEGEKGNKAFAESQAADFPLLSDPTKETANAYGVLNAERGFANRWTFYIGKDGKIPRSTRRCEASPPRLKTWPRS